MMDNTATNEVELVDRLVQSCERLISEWRAASGLAAHDPADRAEARTYRHCASELQLVLNQVDRRHTAMPADVPGTSYWWCIVDANGVITDVEEQSRLELNQVSRMTRSCLSVIGPGRALRFTMRLSADGPPRVGDRL